jgi:hypothetical protein
MNGHQADLKDFAYLSEYEESDRGFTHLEASKYIYQCCDMGMTALVV